LFQINFLITLLSAGLIYALVGLERPRLAFTLGLVFVCGIIFQAFALTSISADAQVVAAVSDSARSAWTFLFSGLRAGLLTFGGAYTAIPFIQHDAVEVGRWMTNAQFLDGLALSGLLPAPLIIFSTFVGYVGGGPLGAIAMTIGVFVPAFSFTIIGHEALEKLVENRSAHAFLDGVTAGVVGLISATALIILSETVVGLNAWVIFSLAVIVLFVSKSKWTVAWVVLAAGLFGWLFL
jgi:chromate transporter